MNKEGPVRNDQRQSNMCTRATYLVTLNMVRVANTNSNITARVAPPHQPGASHHCRKGFDFGRAIIPTIPKMKVGTAKTNEIRNCRMRLLASRIWISRDLVYIDGR